jgi:hypothetical protein
MRNRKIGRVRRERIRLKQRIRLKPTRLIAQPHACVLAALSSSSCSSSSLQAPVGSRRQEEFVKT